MSPGKMMEEQKKKEQLQKKSEMLKEFEVPEKDKNRYINIEPSTQAMKNSLDIIGSFFSIFRKSNCWKQTSRKID